MNDDLHSDPLMRLLADLPAITPRVRHDRRVISRCHAGVISQVRKRDRALRARAVLSNTLDVVCGAAVAFYAAAAVSEALRLAFMQ